MKYKYHTDVLLTLKFDVERERALRRSIFIGSTTIFLVLLNVPRYMSKDDTRKNTDGLAS
jgi:hypothetical protein